MKRFEAIAGVAVAVAAALCGCSTAAPSYVENVRVVYRFENVRLIGEFDEWPHVLDVLTSRAVSGDPPVKVESSAEHAAGSMRVKDYRAALTVARLSDVDLINADLHQLAQRRFGRETIEFKLMDATAELKYRSNYVVAAIVIEVSGFTDPGATLTVVLHDGTESKVDVASDGSWRSKFQIAAGRRYVYGWSADRSGGVRKFFRIDVFTQQHEPIASADFAKLREVEP